MNARTGVQIPGITLLLCLSAVYLRAEPSAPKPSAEISKFQPLIGKWKLTEVDEASPFSLQGEASFDEEFRFVHDGFALEESGAGKVGGKPLSYSSIHVFDVSAHVYRTFYSDSSGFRLYGYETIDDNLLKGHGIQNVGGKSYKTKSELKLASDGKTFTYDSQYSEDGVHWKYMWKGSGKKVGDAQ